VGIRSPFYIQNIIKRYRTIKYAYLPKPVKKESNLVNEAIRFKEVMCILENGDSLGVIPTSKAIDEAYKRDLDLVCVAPQAQPPVCKILNYSKFRYEKEKKEKEASKNQKIVEVKEVQLSPVIMEHDFNTKLNQARKFLDNGDKVKVSIRMFRRFMPLLDQAMANINNFKEKCADLGTTDKEAVLEGNTITLLINPIKKKNSKGDK